MCSLTLVCHFFWVFSESRTRKNYKCTYAIHTYIQLCMNFGFIYTWPYGMLPARLLCPWGLSRQEYWSGSPCLPRGDLDSRIKSTSLMSPALACRFFTTCTTKEAPHTYIQIYKTIYIKMYVYIKVYVLICTYSLYAGTDNSSSIYTEWAL